MDGHQPLELTWHGVEAALRRTAEAELAAGCVPAPTLVAFDGDDPIAVATLRPFDRRGALQALVEVLALLLPLGVDRLGLLLAGRAWSLEDPVPPVCEDGDLRQEVVVLVRADGHDRPATVTASLHAVTAGHDAGERRLGPAITDTGEPEAPLVEALHVLLDQRHTIADAGGDGALLAQLGRVLLLGHELVLSPTISDRLTLADAV